MSAVAVDVADLSQTHARDDICHFYCCCDRDIAWCGSDLTGDDECYECHHSECVVCIEMVNRPCPLCGMRDTDPCPRGCCQ